MTPLERADKVRELWRRGTLLGGTPLLPPGSLIVTPEDRDKGFRVLTPDEAEKVRAVVDSVASRLGDHDDNNDVWRAYALLARKGQT